MNMYLNNKGSVLVSTLITFSIVVITTTSLIGICYNNSKIFNLEYRDIIMKQKCYSAIEIVNNNISENVMFILQNSFNKEQFNDYFLNIDTLNKIKDISKSSLIKVDVSIPTKIEVNKEKNIIRFQVLTTLNDNQYSKKIQANVDIKNPFTDINKNEENINANLNKVRQESDLKTYNLGEIIKIYDYKEI